MKSKYFVVLGLVIVLALAVLVIAAETKIFVNQNMMGNSIINVTSYNLTSTGTITSNATCKVLIKGLTSIICVE